MIPTLIQPDEAVPIPPALKLFTSLTTDRLADADYEALWGKPVGELFFNLSTIDRIGQSVLVPGLHRSSAPRLWSQVQTQIANRKGDYITRQTQGGLRIWKVR
jgi:hypothetical protein